jgi:cell division protein FtsW (lipid II flippase)
MLCRYVFVFYIALFLWEGVLYLLDERGIKPFDRRAAEMEQKLIILLFHTTAFLILTYRHGLYSFDPAGLVTGGVGLAFLLAVMALTELLYKKGDPLIWNGMLLLLDIGFVMLYRLNPSTARHQLVFAAIGFAAALLAPLAFVIVSKIDKISIIYLLLSLGLLALPFFFGDKANGALNWVIIGPVRFQPSEIVKFFFIFYLACEFKDHKPIRKLVLPAGFTAVFILILVAQSDLGGALIFFMTFMIMFYITTGRELLFFAGLVMASGASWVAYKLFAHVQTRVQVWLNPWSDPYDKGHQILQSLFAIGTWGLFGSGLTRGAPGTVPVAASDFIFAAVCEEFGGLFGVLLICVYIMIFYRGVNISLRAANPYHSLLAAGFTSLLSFQTFLILGGVTKFIPLTGVTMPFVSAGGSSVVVSIIMLGIVQKIGRDNLKAGLEPEHAHPKPEKPAETYTEFP